jgi:hypothetical protein
MDDGIPFFGCQFCYDGDNRRSNKYFVFNSKYCYVSCDKSDCISRAVQTTHEINTKVHDEVDCFLKGHATGGDTVQVDGINYQIDLDTVNVSYDTTEPCTNTRDNFYTCLYTAGPVGSRAAIFLTEKVAVSRNTCW